MLRECSKSNRVLIIDALEDQFTHQHIFDDSPDDSIPKFNLAGDTGPALIVSQTCCYTLNCDKTPGASTRKNETKTGENEHLQCVPRHTSLRAAAHLQNCTKTACWILCRGTLLFFSRNTFLRRVFRGGSIYTFLGASR